MLNESFFMLTGTCYPKFHTNFVCGWSELIH